MSPNDWPLRRPRRAKSLHGFLAAVALFGCAALPPGALADTYEDFNRAVATDDVTTLGKLLGRGMDPNTANEKGEPALLTAARESSPAVVKALLTARARVNIKNSHGDTPIMLAALRGNVDVVRLLRQAGAEINPQGWTPLHYAVLNGHNAVIEYLLSSGADLGLVAPNGASPVMLAVLGKKADTLSVLIINGFDVNVRNGKGETALMLARRQQSEEMETLLRQAGARQ